MELLGVFEGAIVREIVGDTLLVFEALVVEVILGVRVLHAVCVEVLLLNELGKGALVVDDDAEI